MSCFKSLLAFKWGQEEGRKKRSETHQGNVSSQMSVYLSVPALSSSESSRNPLTKPLLADVETEAQYSMTVHTPLLTGTGQTEDTRGPSPPTLERGLERPHPSD